MRPSTLLPLLAVLAAASNADFSRVRRDVDIHDSPSNSYAPVVGACPQAGVTIRRGQTIDSDEAAYIQGKTVSSLGDWTDYLTRIGLDGLDISTFVPSSADAVAGNTVPNLGFAVSGGGVRFVHFSERDQYTRVDLFWYNRAMLIGGGILNAFDSRNATSVKAKSGGVLQLAQYMTGLSGSSWLVGSWALANFPLFTAMRDQVWNLVDGGFFTPKTFGSFADGVDSINRKAKAGSPTSIVDACKLDLPVGLARAFDLPFTLADGRTLAYRLFNETRKAHLIELSGKGPGGSCIPTKLPYFCADYSQVVTADTLWSSIKATSHWKDYSMPFPLVVTTGREFKYVNVSIESPMYEFTPYHFGTNTPSSGGLYVPIEYLGTKFAAGTPANNKTCVTGFENAGFIMGCSGNVFGTALSETKPQLPLTRRSTGDPVQLAESDAFLNTTALKINGPINKALSNVPDQYLDNGRIINPFYGLAAETGFPPSDDAELAMTDGGLGVRMCVHELQRWSLIFSSAPQGEVIPLWPLIQPQRALDAIIAIDSSADTKNLPDGTEIWDTYQKTLLPGYGQPFPVIPPRASFLSQGLNKRPVFFGSSCYAQPKNVTTPTIIYLPNYSIDFNTNTSTWITQYTVDDQQGFFNNGFALATQSESPTWSSCLACALVDAQLIRNGDSRSLQCAACFVEYCYMGEK
ncbi:lysophospholipase, partial [Phenoliferia sp. Uapishka_3]